MGSLINNYDFIVSSCEVSVPSRGNGVLNLKDDERLIIGFEFPSPLGAMGSLINVEFEANAKGVKRFRPLSGQWGP